MASRSAWRGGGAAKAEPLEHGAPDAGAGAGGEVVAFADDDVGVPVVGGGHELVVAEEEGLGEDDRTDDGIGGSAAGVGAAVVVDASEELVDVADAVAAFEGHPGLGDGHLAGLDEEATAGDDVAWGVELEQEGVAGLERAERLAAGAPEVDVVGCVVAELAEPVPVGDADEGLHGRGSTGSSYGRSASGGPGSGGLSPGARRASVRRRPAAHRGQRDDEWRQAVAQQTMSLRLRVRVVMADPVERSPRTDEAR